MKLKGGKKNFFVNHGFVQPGDVVFDVGCVGGKFTVQFLGAGARVVCVEADPRNIKSMRGIYGDRITLVHAALTDYEGMATFHNSKSHGHKGTLVPDIYLRQWGKPADVYDVLQEVRAVTIDSLVQKYGQPAFIKLDIEGGEYAALRGMTVPVAALSFEFASGYIEQAYKCTALLGGFGYVFNYVSGHHGEFQLREWQDVDEFKVVQPVRNEDGKLTWGNVYARLRDD